MGNLQTGWGLSWDNPRGGRLGLEDPTLHLCEIGLEIGEGEPVRGLARGFVDGRRGEADREGAVGAADGVRGEGRLRDRAKQGPRVDERIARFGVPAGLEAMAVAVVRRA